MFPEGRASWPVLAKDSRFVKIQCCELGQLFAHVQSYDWLVYLMQFRESWASNNDDEPLYKFLFASQF